MKHMILSFKMKEDDTSDQCLMLWFQKDSPYTVGFKTFRGTGVGLGIKEIFLNFAILLVLS